MANIKIQKDIDHYKEMIPIDSDSNNRNRSLYMFPWSPLFPLALHRFGHFINERWDKRKSLNPVRLLFKALYHIGRFLSVVMRKIEIEQDAQIAEGVFLSPKGGIILGANSIGGGCTIHHNVTIGFGFGSGRKMERPIIGKNVWIGHGAIIFGNIKIEDGAVICPDTVVNRFVPPRCVVKGNPIKILRRNYDNKDMLKSTSTNACDLNVFAKQKT